MKKLVNYIRSLLKGYRENTSIYKKNYWLKTIKPPTISASKHEGNTFLEILNKEVTYFSKNKNDDTANKELNELGVILRVNQMLKLNKEK